MPTETKPSLLFIDDEIFFAQGYLEELDDRYNVTLSRKVPDAEIKLKKEAYQYLLAAVDVMMPVPGEWDAKDQLDANRGEATGLVLLRRCRDAIIQANLPVIVLTNRKPEDIKAAIIILDFPEGLVEVRHKAVTIFLRHLPDLVSPEPAPIAHGFAERRNKPAGIAANPVSQIVASVSLDHDASPLTRLPEDLPAPLCQGDHGSDHGWDCRAK